MVAAPGGSVRGSGSCAAASTLSTARVPAGVRVRRRGGEGTGRRCRISRSTCGSDGSSLAVIFIIIELVTLEFTFLMLAVGSLVGGLGREPSRRPVVAADPRRGGAVGAAAVHDQAAAAAAPASQRSEREDQRRRHLRARRPRHVARSSRTPGLVKLDNGETWTARLAASQSGADLDVGDRVVVAAVAGCDRRGRTGQGGHRRRRRKDVAGWMTWACSSGRSS